MIPAKIFNIWLGDGVMDSTYVDKWTTVCKDYEVVKIRNGNCEVKNEWFDKCIAEKNWVNASNYARLWYLYKYGGVYLDSDIEIVKSLNPFLLEDRLVVGSEDNKRVNTAVMISSVGNEMVKRCMEATEKLPTNTRADIASPQVLTDVVKFYGWSNDTLFIHDYFTSLPHRYFYPYHYTEKFTPECITEDTYCVHHWAGSWLK